MACLDDRARDIDRITPMLQVHCVQAEAGCMNFSVGSIIGAQSAERCGQSVSDKENRPDQPDWCEPDLLPQAQNSISTTGRLLTPLLPD